MLYSIFRQRLQSTFDVFPIKKQVFTQDAVDLLFMIAAHESGDFSYIRQIHGVALGIYQMEPDTFYDVRGYAKRRNYPFPLDPMELIIDFSAASIAARVFFLRIPESIPPSLTAKAEYAKKYWNTEKGKATPQLYRNAYNRCRQM